MRLNRRGEIVREEWFASVNIRKEIRLFEDEFVVMPNHAHGIVWIVDDNSRFTVETGHPVGADGRPPLQRIHQPLYSFHNRIPRGFVILAYRRDAIPLFNSSLALIFFRQFAKRDDALSRLDICQR